MQAWVKINSVKKIGIAYYAWDVWIEDVYGELHGFKVTDSTRYCDQHQPTVLLDVIPGIGGMIFPPRYKVKIPCTSSGVGEIIVHYRQIYSFLEGTDMTITTGRPFTWIPGAFTVDP